MSLFHQRKKYSFEKIEFTFLIFYFPFSPWKTELTSLTQTFGLHILENKHLSGDHTQQGYSTPVKLHYNLTFEWPPHMHSAVVSLNIPACLCLCRGLRGGPVERMGSLHQEKQNLWLQVGSGDPDTAHCKETTQGHNTLSHHCWVQDVQNGHEALQER